VDAKPKAEARRPSRWLKPVVFAIACAPLLKVGADAAFGRLGADPIAEVLNRLGWWTLFSLTAVLACTPLKVLFKWTWPLRVRRMLGLFAFFYGVLHFGTYLVLDQGFDFHDILADIVKRKFMTIGFAALVLLTPLAITSTNRMVRRLGFERWKKLHRLIYVAAICGVVHFVWRVKADLREPLAFGAVIALLLMVRLIVAIRASAAKPAFSPR
jgi:sulfoxide reductase heme-binding subunit YedZ